MISAPPHGEQAKHHRRTNPPPPPPPPPSAVKAVKNQPPRSSRRSRTRRSGGGGAARVSLDGDYDDALERYAPHNHNLSSFESIQESREHRHVQNTVERRMTREEEEGNFDPETLTSPARRALFGLDDDDGLGREEEEEDGAGAPRALFGAGEEEDEEEEEESVTPPRRLFGSSGSMDDDDIAVDGGVGAKGAYGRSAPSAPTVHGLFASPPRTASGRRLSADKDTDESESEDETVVEEESDADDDDDDTSRAISGGEHPSADFDDQDEGTTTAAAERRRYGDRNRLAGKHGRSRNASGCMQLRRQGGCGRVLRPDDESSSPSPTHRVISKVRRLNLNSVDVSVAKAEHVQRVDRWTDRRGSPVERSRAVDMDDYCVREEAEEGEEDDDGAAQWGGMNKENRIAPGKGRDAARRGKAPGSGSRRDAFRSLRVEGRIAFENLDDVAMDGGKDDEPVPPPPAEEDVSPKLAAATNKISNAGRKLPVQADGSSDDISPTNVADFPFAAPQPFGKASFSFDQHIADKCDFYSPPATLAQQQKQQHRRRQLRPPSRPGLGDVDDVGDDDAPFPKTPARPRRDPASLEAPGTPRSSRRRPKATPASSAPSAVDAVGDGVGDDGFLPPVSSPDGPTRRGSRAPVPPTPDMERRRRRPVGRTPRASSPSSRNENSNFENMSSPASNSAAGRFDSDFEILGPPLGRGSFGTVHRVKSRVDSQLYAIKVSRRAVRGRAEREHVLREARALAALGDAPAGGEAGEGVFHIVRYHGAWMEGSRLHIQTELCGRNLLQEMESTSRGGFTEGEGGVLLRPFLPAERRTRLLREMLLALELVHRSGLVHLDIKPENIFIKNGRYKLGDFGLAHRQVPGDDDLEEGDSRYMSLEMLEGNREDLTKSDIFSLGATLYEISLLRPLPSHGPEWRSLRTGSLGHLPHTPDPLKSTIRDMMAPEPSERPGAAELLRRRHLLSESERRLIAERNRAVHANRELENAVRRRQRAEDDGCDGCGCDEDDLLRGLPTFGGGGGGGGGARAGRGLYKGGMGLRNSMPARGKLIRHNTWNGV